MRGAALTQQGRAHMARPAHPQKGEIGNAARVFGPYWASRWHGLPERATECRAEQP
jgi:hypothetical protein